MNQISVYDFDPESDPLYQKLAELKENEKVKFGKIEVLLNKYGVYEILSSNLEESCGTLEKCYKRVKEICI